MTKFTHSNSRRRFGNRIRRLNPSGKDPPPLRCNLTDARSRRPPCGHVRPLFECSAGRAGLARRSPVLLLLGRSSAAVRGRPSIVPADSDLLAVPLLPRACLDQRACLESTRLFGEREISCAFPSAPRLTRPRRTVCREAYPLRVEGGACDGSSRTTRARHKRRGAVGER